MKGCWFLSFAKNMGRNIGRNISKNLSSKNNQKHFDHVKQSATDALKTAITNSESFKSTVEIAVPLKYLSKVWRTLELSLINCDINLILIWSENCVVSSATGKKIKMTDKLAGININQKCQQKDKINI